MGNKDHRRVGRINRPYFFTIEAERDEKPATR